MSEVSFLAIPFAGGSARAYAEWTKALGNQFNVIPLELAGRGRRMGEDLAENLDQAVEDIFARVEAWTASTPYVLYGHSMGTLVVYELLKKLNQAGLPAPQEVFLSGRNPPDEPRKKQIHLLPDKEFLEEIKTLGGTPSEFFDSPELLEVFTPILRSDYALLECYEFNDPRFVTSSDITYFYSDEDSNISLEGAGRWADFTSASFEIKQYKGGHFFINQEFENICHEIKQKLIKKGVIRNRVAAY